MSDTANTPSDDTPQVLLEHYLKQLAAQEMSQKVPETRVDISGKGFGHWIFTHTERSVRLGNR